MNCRRLQFVTCSFLTCRPEKADGTHRLLARFTNMNAKFMWKLPHANLLTVCSSHGLTAEQLVVKQSDLVLEDLLLDFPQRPLHLLSPSHHVGQVTNLWSISSFFSHAFIRLHPTTTTARAVFSLLLT